MEMVLQDRSPILPPWGGLGQSESCFLTPCSWDGTYAGDQSVSLLWVPPAPKQDPLPFPSNDRPWKGSLEFQGHLRPKGLGPARWPWHQAVAHSCNAE